ncbi:Quaternary ammonium compound-resistance protein SugE [Caulifigura coniformis]|uniref:Guanidinium exporter n=1 Tax=Caulifigura coniformis TaxID=2527983 RepID=A0A517S8E6_9PLAN|nr:multidrug efflux SMR transporter [Caulifigura coniformis]QDT52392.1 Quaternary ammonium compound-resistance protein SugE [Caulifigura coniformis]
MAWVILVVAGLLEIGWAVGLKLSDGLSKPVPAMLTIIAMIASMVLLGVAVRTLPLGTAYAIWTGIGAVGAVILGIFLFHEPATAGRLLCVAAIVGGIIGLKLLTPTPAPAAQAKVD